MQYKSNDCTSPSKTKRESLLGTDWHNLLMFSTKCVFFFFLYVGLIFFFLFSTWMNLIIFLILVSRKGASLEARVWVHDVYIHRHLFLILNHLLFYFYQNVLVLNRHHFLFHLCCHPVMLGHYLDLRIHLFSFIDYTYLWEWWYLVVCARVHPYHHLQQPCTFTYIKNWIKFYIVNWVESWEASGVN